MWGHFMNEIGFNSAEALNYAKKYNKNDSSADLNAILRGATLNNTRGTYGDLPLTNDEENKVIK
jgi:hypothetical protein